MQLIQTLNDLIVTLHDLKLKKLEYATKLVNAKRVLSSAEDDVTIKIGLGEYSERPSKNAEQRKAIIATETADLKLKVLSADTDVKDMIIEIEFIEDRIRATELACKFALISREQEVAETKAELEAENLKTTKALSAQDARKNSLKLEMEKTNIELKNKFRETYLERCEKLEQFKADTLNKSIEIFNNQSFEVLKNQEDEKGSIDKSTTTGLPKAIENFVSYVFSEKAEEDITVCAVTRKLQVSLLKIFVAEGITGELGFLEGKINDLEDCRKFVKNLAESKTILKFYKENE